MTHAAATAWLAVIIATLALALATAAYLTATRHRGSTGWPHPRELQDTSTVYHGGSYPHRPPPATAGEGSRWYPDNGGRYIKLDGTWTHGGNDDV